MRSSSIRYMLAPSLQQRKKTFSQSLSRNPCRSIPSSAASSRKISAPDAEFRWKTARNLWLHCFCSSPTTIPHVLNMDHLALKSEFPHARWFSALLAMGRLPLWPILKISLDTKLVSPSFLLLSLYWIKKLLLLDVPWSSFFITVSSFQQALS